MVTTEFRNGILAPRNCAVRERTADGDSVGRCFHFVGDDDLCPRHGDVSEIMLHYRETGELGEDPRYPRVDVRGSTSP